MRFAFHLPYDYFTVAWRNIPSVTDSSILQCGSYKDQKSHFDSLANLASRLPDDLKNVWKIQ